MGFMNKIGMYSKALALSGICVGMILHARITHDDINNSSDDLVKNTVEKELKKASSKKEKNFFV